MKEGIHPEYRTVAFKDAGADHIFLIRSTVKASEKTTVDGVEYPMVNLDTSSLSHPFYTGKQKVIDTGGRVSRFNNRYGKKA
ncbi:type B 50S ribosomal protein L31 [Sinimarinibacterium sp. NLF-5-8]|uniref:type B 50S ribosomal protein L31 n=1 Tax=Sinimarinibacterium sp. NLF-5-8 TaxID=2698684 RepID=UPI00137BC808|nr:type B 50S ribosomal protein L31 [Sinimarinibacterium sp. NLF-5-8]QHS10776.1 type B 50S ribosomal protein L31 [Sinimarinibacterium sp. NLF-5-8]